MRKLTSKAEREKKQKRNQIIVGVVLIIVMFFSVVGYGFMDNEDDSKKIEFNGFEFTSQNDFWFTQIGDFVFAFRNNPSEVENVETSLNYLNSYSGKPLYLSATNKEAEIEITSNLNQIAQRIQYACLDEDNCLEGRPIKTCSNNFIIIEESDKNEIVQTENCVFIRGEEEKLVELSDEFLLRILGIK